MKAAQLNDVTNIRNFILAGNARVTFVSQRTGKRFTFHVRKADVARRKGSAKPHFVRVLVGPDNGTDYVFIGTIFDEQTYRRSKKRMTDAQCNKAFEWVWQFIAAGKMPPECEVWHEGKCGRCGRALTVPSSIESGFGPTCSSKVGG